MLVAASGLAREVAESARRAGWDVIGCLDDTPALAGSVIMAGLPVLGGLEEVAKYPNAWLLLCAGKGVVREAMAESLRAHGVDDERYAVLVDPSVTVPPSCTIGVGSILLFGTVLTASVTVGRHVVCMPNVVLTHDDHVEDFGTLCAGVLLGGGVTVGKGAYLGMGSAVRENATLGPRSKLGMASALLGDTPAGSIWVGTPAKSLEERPIRAAEGHAGSDLLK